MGNEISFTKSEIQQKIEKYPYLNIENKMGATNYIDFLKWSDVKHPVMYGFDICNRLFFVVKGKINNEKVMQTFFQRYTDGNSWNSGANYTTRFIRTEGGMTDDQFKFLFKLISEKKALIDNNVKPNYDFFENKIIELYDNDLEIISDNFASLTF